MQTDEWWKAKIRKALELLETAQASGPIDAVKLSPEWQAYRDFIVPGWKLFGEDVDIKDPAFMKHFEALVKLDKGEVP